jgi:hypothetical protein
VWTNYSQTWKNGMAKVGAAYCAEAVVLYLFQNLNGKSWEKTAVVGVHVTSQLWKLVLYNSATSPFFI